jgi:hypothetical protein
MRATADSDPSTWIIRPQSCVARARDNLKKSLLVTGGSISDGNTTFILIVLDIQQNRRICEWFCTRDDPSCLWNFIALYAPEKNTTNSRLRIAMPCRRAGPPQYIEPSLSLREQLKGDTTEPFPRVSLVVVPNESGGRQARDPP